MLLAMLGSILFLAFIHLATEESKHKDSRVPIALDEGEEESGNEVSSDSEGGDDEGGPQNAYTDTDESDDDSGDDGSDSDDSDGPPPCTGPTCYMQGFLAFVRSAVLNVNTSLNLFLCDRTGYMEGFDQGVLKSGYQVQPTVCTFQLSEPRSQSRCPFVCHLRCISHPLTFSLILSRALASRKGIFPLQLSLS